MHAENRMDSSVRWNQVLKSLEEFVFMHVNISHQVAKVSQNISEFSESFKMPRENISLDRDIALILFSRTEYNFLLHEGIKC